MEAFIANPKIVWEWYSWRRELMAKVKPNPGHYAIREMERFFDRLTLITQNVDNLHRLAGSSDILELHGNIYRNKCADCNTPVDLELDIDPDAIPVCDKCQGRIRPDVVWFGEMLPQQVIAEAFQRAEQAEIFFSIGTSALVQPAASLPLAAKRQGATLVEINPERTPLTGLTDFFVQANSGEFLPKLVTRLEELTGRK